MVEFGLGQAAKKRRGPLLRTTPFRFHGYFLDSRSF